MAEKYFIIAGYGKYQYVKKISKRKAKAFEENDKTVFGSYYEAKQELEKLKR